jgi:MoaA/NifB/PqqE/SkfB family radical SAM enzyme
MNSPHCFAPFTQLFSGDNLNFRNCCGTNPQIQGDHEQVIQWWNSNELNAFRDKLNSTESTDECYSCYMQENSTGESFRTHIEKFVVENKINNFTHPSMWHIKFGNACNLACWTCNEWYSSSIQKHKKSINILPVGFQDPNKKFHKVWSNIKESILESFNYHETILLTVVGGEPMFNKDVIDFLNLLIDKKLSHRTIIQFHTNATKFNKKLFNKNIWKYVSVFLSVDAVGKKAEWLRYGCEWDTVERNISLYKLCADYVEMHCSLSVLNINDLPKVNDLANSLKLPLIIQPVIDPYFMSLRSWTNKDIVNIKDQDFQVYYDSIGESPNADAPEKLRQYIKQFDSIRTPLSEVDPFLSTILGLDNTQK